MNDWPGLGVSFLRTDPRDVGCDQAMQMLHVYVELVAAGGPAEQRYPVVARRTCARAARAARTSRGYWPRCAATRTDRRVAPGQAALKGRVIFP